MKNINLCEILKGHEGETFYSPIYGENIKLRTVHPHLLVFENTSSFLPNGSCNEGGECLLFPSKDQRDWNKWIEEQKSKVPKTWSELVKFKQADIYTIQCSSFVYKNNRNITNSALALLKINQLIEVGYGGNITNEEWVAQGCRKWVIVSDSNDGNFIVVTTRDSYMRKNPAFHTEEQAEEFLKYPENIQLLKDYFMI